MNVPPVKTSRPRARQSIAHIPPTSALNEKENVTADMSSMHRSKSSAAQAEKRKSRSKSLGPGGLEALKETTGNAVKPSPTLPIKSILKPAIPLTPPKAIPTFDETRKRSTSKSNGKSPGTNDAEDLLIDFSTPASSANPAVLPISMEGSKNVMDPFSPITRSKSPKNKTGAGGTEEEQEVLAHELEAEERRRSEKQAILEQRAARRKSMANRRVSFAPEATLHTWNVIELAEDSTTSSASNSTRRQSSMTAAHSPVKNPKSPVPDIESTATPSTPPEHTRLVEASPAHQRDMHQKNRRRRSSRIQTSVDAGDDVPSSSPFGGSSTVDARSSPMMVEESIDSEDDDIDADGDTAMSVEEGTSQSVASDGSRSSTQSSLDERLRKAATQAGTRGIDFDESGDDLSMDLATGTVTNAFQPWVRKGEESPVEDPSATQDQENVNPFSSAFKARGDGRGPAELQQEDAMQDMSMDVTTAVGGILSRKSSPGKSRRKSVGPSRRRSSVARRRSSGGESAADDESMDLTVVGGGIIQQAQPPHQMANMDNTNMSDEDMSMELTNMVGGVLKTSASSGHESSQYASIHDKEDREMTMAVGGGGILQPIEEQTELPMDQGGEKTAGMDFTAAVGTILPPSLGATTKSKAKQLMEQEADTGQLPELPPPNTEDSHSAISPTKTSAVASHFATPVASETGSPSLALKPRLSARSNATRHSTPPKSNSRLSTPLKNGTAAHETTPTKQLTPLPDRASTPNKTPILSNVAHRGASPKKLFKAEIKAKASPASAQKSASKQSKLLFDRDEQTGQQTPSVVLHAPKPHQHLRRRSNGLGINQEGLGSPRVAEVLDRRASIGEVASAFVSDLHGNRILHFDDPRAMEVELDAEREEEERRESGRFVMEQEADQGEPQDENVTLQLKEMIESMTPKKSKPSKLRGRKSLHVGAAKGILGKRPAELDFEDGEEGEETTPKRLKAVSREGSPVKQVHLPRPPSKDETTGRITRAKRHSLEDAAGNQIITPTLLQSPSKGSTANSPPLKGRFKDIPVDSAISRPTSFEDKLDNVLDAVDISVTRPEGTHTQEGEQEKIPLQTFLNMTNIHFIELSTTKRRHTAAPATFSQPSHEGQPASLESCFAAAATTLPLLELYQHATRELKSYISSGRRIIRSIEAETLEEQPPLFREYVDARPDIKMIMDNQFRNGKTNARLQSKEGWYGWRGQLVDGLRGGLEGIRRGMEDDAVQLTEQEQILDSIVPRLKDRHDQFEQEEGMLRQRIEEMESADQEALRAARSDLDHIDLEVSQKQELLERLREQMRDKEETLCQAAELKDEFRLQIEEAERVIEESRGWSPKSVLELKAKVEQMEKETGWALITAEEDVSDANDFGVALTMRYQNSLKLFCYPSAFQEITPTQSGKRRSRSRKSKSDCGPFAPISLTYSPMEADSSSPPPGLPTEERFFLQLLQSQLHAFAAMSKGTGSATTVLSTVSSGWQAAQKVCEEIRLLNIVGLTSASILGDEKLGVTTMILLQGVSRIDIDFSLHVAVDRDGHINTTSSVTAKAIYGPVIDLLTGAKSAKVHQALAKEIVSREMGTGAWVGAVKGFQQWVAVQQQTLKGKQKADEKERLPLSPRKTPNVQKKPAPMPLTQHKGQMQNAPAQADTYDQESKQKARTGAVLSEDEKENVPEPPSGSPQWTPMTPIKRVAALRRSPIVG